MQIVDVVANVIAEDGHTDVFGLMGDGNMAFITQLTSELGVTFHSSRHESAAVGMADGYSRISGEPGICTVTQGPGLTNAVTALVTARKAGTPLVLFVGDVPAAQNGWPQDLDHHRLLESLDIPVIEINDPGTAHLDAEAALNRARSERRPVAINMRIDKQKQEWAPWDTDDSDAADTGEAAGAPDPDSLSAVSELIGSASRPVIVAGRGAKHATDELVRLGDRIGALMATTLPGKGLFEGHPYDVGIAGSLSTNLASSLIGRADLVLAFGASLNDFTSVKKTFFHEQAKIVRVDLVPSGDRPNRLPAHVEVLGDAAAVASALAESAPAADPGFRTLSVTEAIAAFDIDSDFVDNSDETGMDPRTFVRKLDGILPAQATVVTDVGHFFGFPATYLSQRSGCSFVPAVEFGAVGSGLGVAVGASIAGEGCLTVAFIGDGGLMMSLGDLETALRESTGLLIVVMNDDSYGSELHMLRAWDMDVSAAVFPSLSFEGIATSLGIESTTVKTVEELEEAVAGRISPDGPLRLVDCRITTRVVADWLAGAFDH